MLSLMEIFPALILLVLSVFLIVKKKTQIGKKYLKNMPGPKPNLFLGNLIDFIGPTSRFLSTLKEYSDTYGGIVKVYDGPISIAIIVSDLKLMEYIFSSTVQIPKAKQYDFFHNWLGTGLLTSTGRKWKKRRKVLTPAFHFSILEQFVDVFNSVGEVFVQKLEKEMGKSSIDIYPLVTLCTLDIICEAAMGVVINAQDNEKSDYVQSVKTMCAIVTSRIFSPLDPSFYPFTWNYFKEKRALNVLHTHTDSVIDQRIRERTNKTYAADKNEFGIKKRVAFLDLLLGSTIDGQPLSRADLREEVDTFMFEGHDTTSSAISFTLFSLANNPEVQKKAAEEQTKLFGDNKNPHVTASDLQEMKYLELVIKEALRLYPSVPFIGRGVSEEFEWDGVLYPKGINLMLFPYATQRNSDYFPEPDKFIPERFETGKEVPLFSYVPFSAGPRNCIGQKFAMLEMKSTISRVLRNFELCSAKPKHELQLAPEIILISKNGIRISLKKRTKL